MLSDLTFKNLKPNIEPEYIHKFLIITNAGPGKMSKQYFILFLHIGMYELHRLAVDTFRYPCFRHDILLGSMKLKINIL